MVCGLIIALAQCWWWWGWWWWYFLVRGARPSYRTCTYLLYHFGWPAACYVTASMHIVNYILIVAGRQ